MTTVPGYVTFQSRNNAFNAHLLLSVAHVFNACTATLSHRHGISSPSHLSVMESQAPLLAPAVAKAMQHQSTVVRKEAAAAIHCLLGDAPAAMARCATAPSHVRCKIDTCWIFFSSVLHASDLPFAHHYLMGVPSSA